MNGASALTAAAIFYLLRTIFQGKVATLELGAFWTIFWLVWALIRREARFRWHILYFPLALYGLASTLSAALAERREHSAYEAMLWFKMLLFPAALTLFMNLPRLKEWAIKCQAVFGVGVATYGLVQYYLLGRRDLDRRITGLSTHVLTYSNVLLILSLLFLVLWLHRRRPWLLAVTAILTFALGLTFTRSVWLAWIAAVAVLLVIHRPRWLAYALTAAVIVVVLLPLPFFGRLVSVFDMRQQSNLDRVRMVEAGIEIIKDYPLLGVGPANIKEVYVLYRKPDAPRFRIPHLHNNVVQVWAERGILALTAYLLFIVMFTRECIRGLRTPQRIWGEIGIVMMVGLAVAGLFEFNWGDTEVFYLTLDVSALVVAALNEPASAAVRDSP